MAGEAVVTIIGNIGRDPELRFTAAGVPVANFSVCSTPRTFDKDAGEWKDGDPLWLECSAWREMAEHVAESLHRGNRVVVQGVLSVREYENREGVKGKSVELNVLEIGPSLKYATAVVTRTNAAGIAPIAKAG